MAIFGINFNNFGSKKLRFDSQKKEEINFEGDKKYPPLMKYAPPENPDKKEITIKKEKNLNPNYKILTPYFVVPISQKPKKTDKSEKKEPPLIKYGFPPEK